MNTRRHLVTERDVHTHDNIIAEITGERPFACFILGFRNVGKKITFIMNR